MCSALEASCSNNEINDNSNNEINDSSIELSISTTDDVVVNNEKRHEDLCEVGTYEVGTKDLCDHNMTVRRKSGETSNGLTFREQLLSVEAAGDHSGMVEVSGQQYYIFEDRAMEFSRGKSNRVFSTMFCKTIKKLYWYRPYFGFLSKFQAVCGNCMLECGNILVMLMETRCANPHYHLVIYYAKTKECAIVNNPSRWPLKRFVLRPDIPLIVAESELER